MSSALAPVGVFDSGVGGLTVARAIIDQLEYRVDVNTLEHVAAAELRLNEVGRVRLRTSAPLIVDPYARNRTTGSFILIDEATNSTVGAGMISDVPPDN